MLHRKLLEILTHLTTAEKKRLHLFLASPYFNNGTHAKEIIRLYDHIIRNKADEKHPALSKEAVFQLFFPNKKFEANVKTPLDALASKLFLLVRRFIAQSELERQSGELQEHLALAKFYRKFAFEERFWQTMLAMRLIQRDAPLRDAQYYYDQFRIEETELLFRSLYNSLEYNVNLPSVNNNLDLFYSILKLEFTCSIGHQKQGAPQDRYQDDPLVKAILELSKNHGRLDIPIIRLYQIVLDLLQNPDDNELNQKFAILLNQHEANISLERFNDFKSFQRFFGVQRYHKFGDNFSLNQTFDIYCEHLAHGYFYIDGLIPMTSFRNLVILGLKLGAFDWVKQFLDTHPPVRIGITRYPAEIHSLNKAEYHFSLKSYDLAEAGLIYKPFENPIFSLLADMLMVKIYYETQDELLDARMKALDQKVRRSKLNRQTKNRYFNFLKKLDKIIKYGWQPKSPKRAKLIEEIKSTPEIASREWLLEKLSR